MTVTMRKTRPGTSLAQALLSPRSVMLIGASGDPGKTSSRPQRYLRHHGFTGPIYPVNPGRDEILGEKAYPDVLAVGRPVDHAYIMVASEHVEQAVADCGTLGVPCATILSDGYSETGETGRKRQASLVRRARASGIRVLGPNSLGIINVAGKVALSANAALSIDRFLPGSIGLVSQSGSALGMLLSRAQARGVGLSTLVSVGNESDLGVAEIAEMLLDQPETETVLLFLETVRDGPALAAMAARAFTLGKPVIAFLLGRSSIGQEISASHTGALATDYAATEAFLRDSGIMRVDMLETLFELPPLVKHRKPPQGRRVSIVTTTGGGGGMVADLLGQTGITVAAPSDDTVARLAGRGIRIKQAPLVDLTMAGARKDIYGAVLEELAADQGSDLIVAVVGSSSQFHPELAVSPIVHSRGLAKPVAAFLTPQATDSLSLLAEAGVAGFRTPEACADGVRAFLEWRAPRPFPDAAAAATLLARLPEPAKAGTLNERDSLALFARLAIPVIDSTVITDPERPGAFDGISHFPAVLKILSADVAHKTEAGGVVLAIPDRAALEEAARLLLGRFAAHNPAARLDGLVVQPMLKGLCEALVGFRRVSKLGAIVTVAAGGTLVELQRDFACAHAPLDLDQAREMIAAVRGFAPIRGYRGLPRGDCEALAKAVQAISQLALLPWVQDAEINPLIVMPEGQGVMAVDGLVIAAPDTAA